MKILITGATGRLGREVVTTLQKEGHDIRATDLRPDRELPVRIEVANLLNRESCYHLTEDVNAIIHVGNLPNEEYGDAQKLVTDNTQMNINLFQAAADNGVGRLAYASSVQVVSGRRRGSQTDEPSSLAYLPLDGNLPPNPGNGYALSKVLAEETLHYMYQRHEIHSAAFRFPWLMRLPAHRGYDHGGEDFSPMMVRHMRIDEGFALLSYRDAAKLLVAEVTSDLPGARIYLPAMRETFLYKRSFRYLVDRWFGGVPLKSDPDTWESMADLTPLKRDYDFDPEPFTWRD